MASGGGLQQQQQQQSFQPYQCKECGLSLNSAESLDVHLQYHKENLLKHWAVQAASSHSHSEETNNNTTKANGGKREFHNSSSVSAAADSSEMQKKSPEYNRATPEGNAFGHPPTPQSYQSGSSPYQSHDNSAFSPNFQNSFAQIKSERSSPSAAQQQQHQQQSHFAQNSFPNYPDQQFFAVDSSGQQHYAQEASGAGKSSLHQNHPLRYHPYPPQQSPYERPKSQVPPASPAYPPQPTPSPSPKQCDKCGYVCESAAQLIEHINVAHPPTPALPYQNSQHFMFEQTPKSEEDASQSEILDLDSHKVVHPAYGEEEKRQDPNNPHSVSAMLGSWQSQQPQHSPSQQAASMFHQEAQQSMFLGAPEQKLFHGIADGGKMFSPEQKLFQPHQAFANNGVSSSNSDLGGGGLSPLGHSPQQPYRPFEHLPSQASTVITSTQVPNGGGGGAGQGPAPPSTKSASWKSNEARRPKTYNCTACNKWFTSSGHLKRHYNTTLHKNAVKSSGQPDPASLPISAHHHPARELSNKEDRAASGGSPDDGRDDQFERLQPMPPGLLQQPAPYDRQPAPNIHHGPPPPLGQHHSPLGGPGAAGFPALPNGGSPNGEAGLSPNTVDSRGLLSSMTSPHHGMPPNMQHGFNMAPPPMVHQMEGGQFQMYPNESAPHVTQAMAINNHSTIGEFQFGTGSSLVEENQPLPSFAQFQAHRFGVVGYVSANVGGGGPATAPYTAATTYFIDQMGEAVAAAAAAADDDEDDDDDDEGEYKLTVLTAADAHAVAAAGHHHDDAVGLYSPPVNNNNDDDLSAMTAVSVKTEEDSKLGLLDDKLHFEFVDVRHPPELQQQQQQQPPPPPQQQQQPAQKRSYKKNQNHIKQDYEETTGSPLISSTVPNQDGKTKCFDCDKVFNRPCYLTQHNKTCHNGDKPFKCTRCGKRFSSEDIYQEHAAKHAGEKPHKCEICPKQFNHKTDLRRHMCCHTGRKPYICVTCGKGFIRKDHMVKHMDTHLRKSANKAQAAAMRA